MKLEFEVIERESYDVIVVGSGPAALPPPLR